MKKYNKIIIIIISFLLFDCSSTSDKEYFDSANQKIKEGNYTEALVDFETLVKEYPESGYAAKSLFEIGKMYHGKIIKNLSGVESLRKAIFYYREVYMKYGKEPEAPNALFMIAFLQANELQELDSAKISYELFIEKFPYHELIASAKAEVQNLGVPPEEFLKNKIKASD